VHEAFVITLPSLISPDNSKKQMREDALPGNVDENCG
jgi:hypothetical protein